MWRSDLLNCPIEIPIPTSKFLCDWFILFYLAPGVEISQPIISMVIFGKNSSMRNEELVNPFPFV
jgi:hypothetical protein